MLRRGPGVMRTVARTAVVAGTATAVVRGVNRRQDRREQEAAAADQLAMQEQVQAAQAQQAQMATTEKDLTAELQKLSDLKAQGALTAEEFNAAKQKLIHG